MIQTNALVPLGLCPKNQFTNLIWSDEFNVTGALDSSKWVHEVGDSWYNNEVQSYTSRLDNSKVEDGKLKIIAKKESYNGNNYTSARIISNTKKDFTYGRVDIKAKIPGKKGTWPALWMLGDNISSVSWPYCGEIDIMELIGGGASNDKTIYGTLHWDDNGSHASYGGNNSLNGGIFADEFHVFSIIYDDQP